jgi:hypothetical protein
MNLYINDKCLERMFELPKETSKKVLEFQFKFRENSRAAAINLEAIHDFKDKKLKTARIDDKYRAIIAEMEPGRAYYLLWVDNHNEAMRWARNKTFEWNPAMGTVQIFTVPEAIPVDREPMGEEPKGLFSRYTDAQLASIGVPAPLLGHVRSIRDLNALGALEKDLPADCFENLFMLSDGVDIQSIIDEVGAGKEVKQGETLSDNQKRFYVVASDKILEEAINGDFDKWRVFLHPAQRRLADASFNGTMRVTGGAGTGKTVVALHRLKHLSDAAAGKPAKRILFSTYTHSLTDHLVGQARRIGVDMTKVMVTNIDSLARELAKKYGVIKSSTHILDVSQGYRSDVTWEKSLMGQAPVFDAGFLHKEYQDVILRKGVRDRSEYLRTSRTGRTQPLTNVQRNRVWDLVEQYETYKRQRGLIDRGELFNRVSEYLRDMEEKPFDHVVVDEVQDFSTVELRFIRALVREGPDDLFLVGDSYQRIYVRGVGFSEAGISVRGTRSRQLKVNYRTSEEIRRAAVATVRQLRFDDVDEAEESLNGYLSLFHGDRPSYALYRSRHEEVERLLQAIDSLHTEGVPYNAMAVGVRTRTSMQPFRNELHGKGIPYYDTVDNTIRDQTGIRLTTFHGIKGLEFKAVFLVDVHQGTCPFIFRDFEALEEKERNAYLASERSLMYVAMSRAVRYLAISGTGVRSELIPI